MATCEMTPISAAKSVAICSDRAKGLLMHGSDTNGAWRSDTSKESETEDPTWTAINWLSVKRLLGNYGACSLSL